MENRALLRDCCEQMGVSLGEKETEQFMTYLSLLLEWNEKMNLTAITEPREVVLKHFADCLSLVPCVEWRDGMRVIDVGTGAGFPGIPVKIACPEIELTLLDSLQKRIGFLQRAEARRAFSPDAPVTITSSSTSGHSSKARTLRSRTVSPPRSKLSLSNPIRVEEPAATRTAVTRHSNFLHLPHFIPALRRTAQSVLLFIEYYSVSTHKLQLPAPIKNAPVQHFWRCTGA